MAIIGLSDRASDGEGDAGEFFGDGPEPSLQVLVVGLRAGFDQLRVAALLGETVGAVVSGGPCC